MDNNIKVMCFIKWIKFLLVVFLCISSVMNENWVIILLYLIVIIKEMVVNLDLVMNGENINLMLVINC